MKRFCSIICIAIAGVGCSSGGGLAGHYTGKTTYNEVEKHQLLKTHQPGEPTLEQAENMTTDLEIKGNGTYTMSTPMAGIKTVPGNWTRDGDQITFTYDVPAGEPQTMGSLPSNP